MGDKASMYGDKLYVSGDKNPGNPMARYQVTGIQPVFEVRGKQVNPGYRVYHTLQLGGMPVGMVFTWRKETYYNLQETKLSFSWPAGRGSLTRRFFLDPFCGWGYGLK